VSEHSLIRPVSANDARQVLQALGPLVLGAILCSLLLFALMREEQISFEDFALGKEKKAIYASLDGHPIHCKGVSDAEGCLDGCKVRGFEGTALWFGNSQLHAVNQPQPGQENAPPILGRKLRQRGLDLVAFSQPNANLQEHYVLFEYLRTRLPIRMLILAVVFDDLRETGLRSDIALALADPPTAAALAETEIGRRILEDHRKVADTNDELGGVRQTTQEYSERFLNQWMEDYFPLWDVREQARGRFFIGLYQLRNTLLNVDPQTERPMIKGRYQANFAALEALLKRAHEDGIPVLVYIVPLRTDVRIPYAEREYQAFKPELEELVHKYDDQFADLETLVEGKLWGAKDSTSLSGKTELDFMHFDSEGHRLLAEAIGELILPNLKESRQ
jgi:hypothetical protein